MSVMPNPFVDGMIAQISLKNYFILELLVYQNLSDQILPCWKAYDPQAGTARKRCIRRKLTQHIERLPKILS